MDAIGVLSPSSGLALPRCGWAQLRGTVNTVSRGPWRGRAPEARAGARPSAHVHQSCWLRPHWRSWDDLAAQALPSERSPRSAHLGSLLRCPREDSVVCELHVLGTTDQRRNGNTNQQTAPQVAVSTGQALRRAPAPARHRKWSRSQPLAAVYLVIVAQS